MNVNAVITWNESSSSVEMGNWCRWLDFIGALHLCDRCAQICPGGAGRIASDWHDHSAKVITIEYPFLLININYFRMGLNLTIFTQCFLGISCWTISNLSPTNLHKCKYHTDRGWVLHRALLLLRVRHLRRSPEKSIIEFQQAYHQLSPSSSVRLSKIILKRKGACRRHCLTDVIVLCFALPSGLSEKRESMGNWENLTIPPVQQRLFAYFMWTGFHEKTRISLPQCPHCSRGSWQCMWRCARRTRPSCPSYHCPSAGLEFRFEIIYLNKLLCSNACKILHHC